jgi:Cdc6-like AAA superfamily ATPase
MTIAGFHDDTLKGVLSANLTPSDFIRTPERLFGRAKNVLAIERALSSAGRQIFISGDRGVGKTSLALTAAYLHTDSSLKPIHVNCGRSAEFYAVVQAIGNAVLPPQAKFEHAGSRPGLGGGLAGFSMTSLQAEKPFERSLRLRA